MTERSAAELIQAAESSLDEAGRHEAGVEDEERADYLVEPSQAEAILAIAKHLATLEETLRGIREDLPADRRAT